MRRISLEFWSTQEIDRLAVSFLLAVQSDHNPRRIGHRFNPHDPQLKSKPKSMLRRSQLLRSEILCGLLVLLMAGNRVQADQKDPAKIVVVWPTGPMEVRVAFDRAIEPDLGSGLVGKTIRFDPRQRSLDAWRRQGPLPLAQTQGSLKIAAASVDPERRTLTLTTDPQPREAVYILESQSNPALGTKAASRAVLPAKSGAIAYDLNGISVSWVAEGEGEGEERAWEGWWPEFDPQASRRITVNSREHDRGFALLNRPGRATFESLVVLPKGRVVLKLEGSEPIEASLNGENPNEQVKPSRAEFVVESTGDPNALLLTIPTGRANRPLSLKVTYRGESDQADRTLARDRVVLPWVPPSPPSAPADTNSPPFKLSGGDRDRGEVLFHGDRAKCSGCHKVGGKGGSVGPDLSHVATRRIEELYRDIAEPSLSIHPDFNAYTVALKDGRVLAGIVRALGAEKIQVTDSDAKIAEIPRSEIEELRPSGTSIMPVGLVGAIGEQATRDILAYLLSPVPTDRNHASKP